MLTKNTASVSKRIRAIALAALTLAVRVDALTVGSLLDDPEMTPKHFASLFEKFDFGTGPFEVQNPEQFLASERGDCIDFAVLADYVLSRRGYWTRLIRVEMVGKNMGHAVCYVTESRVYLDYNNRKYALNLQHSGASIRQIAAKVADSFEANWTFAQEFTFDYKGSGKRAVRTVVKTAPPANDADVVNPTARPKARS